eukprot:10635221-Alexandrium_andersonii.AAC.1
MATSAGAACGGLQQPGSEDLQSLPEGSQDRGAERPGLDCLAAGPEDHPRGWWENADPGAADAM